MRTRGYVCLVVVFRGRCLLKPQSPVILEVEGVVIVKCVGYETVAVAE
jgi:hypothetical protein